MKIFRTIYRTTVFAFQNFWRNIWLSIATIMVFVLTLMTINVLVTLNVLTDSAIDSMEDQIDVSVYFKKGTSEDIIFGAQDYMLSLSQVKNAEYVSAEEALIRFRDQHSNEQNVLNALDVVEVNPFGGSLIVTANTPDDFDFILESLNGPSFAEYIAKKDFADHERVIERISSFTDWIRLFALVLAGIFIVIAVLIVMNSIRVSIYTHREEIGIMKLVGASNAFIRLPFLIEAVLFSFIATAITAALVYPAAGATEPYLNVFFDGSKLGLYEFYVLNWYWLFGGQFLALSVLSVFSSVVSITRHLKV